MNERIEKKVEKLRGIGKVSEAQFNALAIDCVFGHPIEMRMGKIKVKVTGDRKKDLGTLAALALAKLGDMEDEEL